MTTTEHRVTVRQTTALVRSGGRAKEVIVALAGDSLILRLKGERKRFRLSAAVAYAIAVQAWVESRKAERKAARHNKRKAVAR
jgi:hypothetical protein